MGCHFLLQAIFPTQGSNLGLPHCRQILYHLNHQGGPWYHYYSYPSFPLILRFIKIVLLTFCSKFIFFHYLVTHFLLLVSFFPLIVDSKFHSSCRVLLVLTRVVIITTTIIKIQKSITLQGSLMFPLYSQPLSHTLICYCPPIVLPLPEYCMNEIIFVV